MSKRHLQPCAHWRIIHNSRDMERTEVCIKGWRDTVNVRDIDADIIQPEKDGNAAFATAQVKLVGTMLSEINQAEKDL